jgi:deoxyribonuclease V
MLPPIKPAIIISSVEINNWPGSQISVTQAKEIQMELAGQVRRQGTNIKPRFVAGVDISSGYTCKTARAAVVVLSYPELRVCQIKTAEDELGFPYVPGLLSFRETPLILAAWRKLSIAPDLLIVDGHGIAHPRRFGIASHLGLLLDLPTIGCAKSRLCGSEAPVDSEVGSFAELTDNGEIIGAVLRSKTGTKPIYISIGHKIDLTTAIECVTRCCQGYRLPEPARLAHIAASGKTVAVLANRI